MPGTTKMSKKEKAAASNAAEAAIVAEAVKAATSVAVSLEAIKAPDAAVSKAWAVATALAEQSKAGRFDFAEAVPALDAESQAALDALHAKAAAKAARAKAWEADKKAKKERRLGPMAEEKGHGGKSLSNSKNKAREKKLNMSDF